MSIVGIIDQGTSSSRVSLFNNRELIAFAQEKIEPQYNHQGWVELSPEAIWASTLTSWRRAVTAAQIAHEDVVALGISNQRETTIVWDRYTGQPIYNAIVWQDRRTHDYCEQLKQKIDPAIIYQKTGLLLDPYFSATKIAWILANVPGAREKADADGLCFGTVDAFLLWRLTDGKVHATDITNAARTLLFNIHTCDYDQELLDLFNIPRSMLPEVKDNNANFGKVLAPAWQAKMPILAMAGDQQAAMMGQDCWQQGDAKVTYGTGGFLMVHTGNNTVDAQGKLLQTIAYRIDNKIAYATEGSIFAAGSIVNWLRDKMQFIGHAADTVVYAEAVKDNGGLYLVPAFTGLGAPYWDSELKAAFVGIDFQTKQEHFVRAALESVAYQTRAIFAELLQSSKLNISELHANGGMSANTWLMQFLADQLAIPVCTYKSVEATTAGILNLLLAAVDGEALFTRKAIAAERTFVPVMAAEQRDELYRGFVNAIETFIPRR